MYNLIQIESIHLDIEYNTIKPQRQYQTYAVLIFILPILK